LFYAAQAPPQIAQRTLEPRDLGAQIILGAAHM
jgi:hypothetical protein